MLRFMIGVACVQFVVGVRVDVGGYYGQAAQPQPSIRLVKPKKKEGQDLSKIPGVAGVDYPIYHTVPETSFSCHNVPAHPGMYANVETGCQAYHVCHDGREGEKGASFLCTNGTVFNQKEFACDWWYNVNCHDATNFYKLNLDPEKNPYAPKKKKEPEPEPEYAHQAPQYHQPAPQYHQPAPQYHQPAPQYRQPAPQYHQPAPQNQAEEAGPFKYVQQGGHPVQQVSQYYLVPKQQQFVLSTKQHYITAPKQQFIVATPAHQPQQQQQYYETPQEGQHEQQHHTQVVYEKQQY